LLIGLDLGPNLVITGSLSAIFWMRVARTEGARPSALTYSKVGLVLVPLSVTAALLALSAFSGS
jgi:arsenical pump membrane protein